METIRKIRLAARDGKKSIRQITKDFNVSRNTVRKVLRSDQTHFEYHRDTVHRPKLGPFIDTLTTLLKHDQPLPLKQRRTAQGYYEALQAEGYRGAYDSVRRFVKRWRAEHQGSPTDAYIPLVFEPGEAFQFDWSHEKIVTAGAMTDVKIAHIRWCHSRLFLTVAYLRESQEMVFDAHRSAFEFFGGVTRRGIYDNMKTAVCRNRRLNTAYLLKETFGQLWDYRTERGARAFFERWQDSLKWQRLQPYRRFAELIESHWDGIASYCHPEHKVSLGLVEGINNKIRVLQRRAYGYRDEDFLKLKIVAAFLPPLPRNANINPHTSA